MEPIPETREALRRLAETGDTQLGPELAEAASALRRCVQGLVGFSISVLEQDITFTYLTSAEAPAGLDAVQYLDGGPCEQAVDSGEVVEVVHEDLLREGQWQLFAQASGTVGVASTLSLPLLDGDRLVGSVNLYGARADTFDGRHEELAALFGAWAPGAVTNADLSFDSRIRAARAVDRLEDLAVVDLAVGLLVATRGSTPQQARRELEQAAARAGVTLPALAHLLMDAHPGPHDDAET